VSPLVQITAVGALVKPADSDRYRPYAHGDRAFVSDEDARRLVGAGQAEVIDDTVALDAEAEQPQPGAHVVSDIDLSEGGTPVAELRKFASARRINLRGATRRPEIVEAIEASLNDPEGGA
jgi:hypothetical protein